MAAPVLQFKRGNLASLPGLQAGEPGFTVDKNDLYVGIDSTTTNNQFIGSARFWEKGDATNASGVKLVEAQNNGASAITIKAPASLSDNQVYTMPASAVNNGFLKCNASGELSFDTAPQNSGAVSDIAVTDESADTTCFPMFATQATGDIQPKTGTNLTFNASSGELTASSFSGNLTGAVTGNVSGSSGSCTGNAATATALETARNIGGVSFDGTANINLPGVNASGNQDTSGNAATATALETARNIGGVSFDGTANINLPGVNTAGSQDTTGNADTATLAATSTITANNSTNETVFPVFVDGATGAQGLESDTGLTYNPSTGALSSTSFVGALTGAVTGNVSGNVTGNVTGNQSGGTVSATSAAVADLTSGRVVLAGSSGELEDNGNLTFDGSTLTVTGAASVTTNLTIGGNLTVNGTTTQVNTTNTTIEDVLLELQVVDGGALSSDTDKDVGLVLNYYSGSAKKAAIYWDDSAGRIALGAEVSESAGVLTASAYSGLEIGSLFVNDCAGQTQVISCSGTTRSLENITIDGGSF